MQKNRDKLNLTVSMAIFGTVGVFRAFIPFSSAFVAFCRGLFGTICLTAVLLLGKKRSDSRAVKDNLFTLFFSGALIGLNWILLFEAFCYTSVSTATVCYYMAPVFASIGAVIFFHEKIVLKKAMCIFLSCAGVALISGLVGTKISGTKGIVLALVAAVFYAGVVLLNRLLCEIDSLGRTTIQIVVATAAVAFYTLFTGGFSGIEFTPFSVIMVIIMGALHTGFAYKLYFASVSNLPTQTVAILSYIDPTVSIILSALLLGETISLQSLIGMIMVLMGTFISEIELKKHREAVS